MRKLLLLLILLPALLSGQNLIQAEYFFDDDPGYGNGIKLNFTENTSVSLSANLSIGAIDPGFHTLYYRVKDDVNGWGHTFSHHLFVNGAVNTPTHAEYFFDEDPGYGKGIPLNFEEDASVSLSANLSLIVTEPGFHTFYYRIKGDNNGWGTTFTQNIFVNEPVQNITDVEYFFDDDPGYGYGISVYDGNAATTDISANISLEMVDPGYHVFYYRSKDEGSWGGTYRQSFFKTLASKLNAVLYSFDDEEAIYLLTLEDNVWLLEDNFDIDITALDEGNHTLHLWVQNTEGALSEVWSENFLKGELAINTPEETSEVKVYPVPASSELHMKTNVGVLSYSILSLNGKEILSGTDNYENIDVSNIPGGVYLLLIRLNSGIEVHTVVVEH